MSEVGIPVPAAVFFGLETKVRAKSLEAGCQEKEVMQNHRKIVPGTHLNNTA